MLFFFFFNDTATTEIYTLSLHDALPIYGARDGPPPDWRPGWQPGAPAATRREAGRTRSSQQHQSDPMSQLSGARARRGGGHRGGRGRDGVRAVSVQLTSPPVGDLVGRLRSVLERR